jgi:DNA (cytosine-5)-methyltransferase 1
MTHLDLFTGIGGFHLAAQWAGFETVGFAEIDPYCIRLLNQNWPDIPNYGDIRTADFSRLRGAITVLSAGVPCQKSSVAGTRAGPDELWQTACDVIGYVKPDWVVFENTPNIVLFHSFSAIRLRLEGMGYQMRAFDVSAECVGADFLGYRTFIIAAPPGLRSSARLLSGSNKKAEWRASSEFVRCPGWQTEPSFPRVANGFPNGKHYMRALGNAVVPQQAFPFFAAIAEVETCLKVSGS